MILFYVLVGFIAGTVAASLALASGAGVLAALVSYSLFGAVAVVVAATITIFAPAFLRSKSTGGMTVGAQAQRR